MEDPLFNLRVNYYLGNYLAALKEEKILQGPSKLPFLALSYAHLKNYNQAYQLTHALSESNELSAMALKSLIKQIEDPKNSEILNQSVQELLQKQPKNQPSFFNNLALFLQNANDVNTAIKLLTIQTHESIEAQALLLNVLLKSNMFDISHQLAVRIANEDDPLAQFSVACDQLLKGEHEEAMATFNELMERFGETPILLNALGICYLMDENRSQEALFLLQKAVEDEHLQEVTLLNLYTALRKNNQDASKVKEQLDRIAQVNKEGIWKEINDKAEKAWEECFK